MSLLVVAIPFSDSPDFALDARLQTLDLAFDDSPAFALYVRLEQGEESFGDTGSFSLDSSLPSYEPHYSESMVFALNTTGINRVWGESESFTVNGALGCELDPNDCNENGESDWCDIFDGESEDRNGNGIPDECETLANLVVQNVVVPDQIVPGQVAPFTWETKNVGSATAMPPWVESVYVSPDNHGGGDFLLCSTTAVAEPIAPGDDADRSLSCTVPRTFPFAPGNYFVVMCTDTTNAVLEFDDSDNCMIAPVVLQSPDLIVESFIGPDQVDEGMAGLFIWRVRNMGQAAASGTWADKLVLSQDAALDSDDTILGIFQHEGGLAAGAAYARSESISFPEGITGNWFVLLVIDEMNQVLELLGEVNNTASKSIDVQQTVLPNLQPTMFNIFTAHYVGQSVSVTWTVTNNGGADASGAWIDRVYLSQDSAFDQLSDTLIGERATATNVRPSETYGGQIQFNLPSIAGNYWLYLKADSGGNLPEADERDNVAGIPIVVSEPEYHAMVLTSINVARLQTPIPLAGQAVLVSGGPAPNVDVDVRIDWRGTRRTYRVQTDAEGAFGFTFYPGPFEGGTFAISADHPLLPDESPEDTFILIGVRSDPASITSSLPQDDMRAGFFTITNVGDSTLKGIDAEFVGGTPALVLEATTPSELASGAKAIVNYTLRSQNAAPGTSQLALRLSADGVGTMGEVRFSVNVLAATPLLDVSPNQLQAGMLRGTRTNVNLAVANVGGITTGPVTVSTATGATWMRVVSSNPLAPLVPNESASLVIELAPPMDLPLGPYSGTLRVASTGSTVDVPFTFTAVSDAVGDLRVEATDEFTYWATGNPRVADASVTVRDAFTNAVVASAVTEEGGLAFFPGLNQAYYRVEVSAPGHGDFSTTIQIDPGAERYVEAFLPRQLVSYQWSVVPTEIEDTYQIAIDLQFETQVPAPVITIDPPTLDLVTLESRTTQRNFTLTNRGLVTAENVALRFGDHPRFQFANPLGQIGNLLPQQSVIVPVVITDNEFDTVASRQASTCEGVRMDMEYFLQCGRYRLYSLNIPVRIPISPGCSGTGVPTDRGCLGECGYPPPPPPPPPLPPPPPPPPPSPCDSPFCLSPCEAPPCGGEPHVSYPSYPILNDPAQECALAAIDCIPGGGLLAECALPVFRGCTPLLFSVGYYDCSMAMAGCMFDEGAIGKLVDIVNKASCVAGLIRDCLCGYIFAPRRPGEGPFDLIVYETDNVALESAITHANRDLAIADYLTYPFGDLIWFESDATGLPMLRAWLSALRLALRADSDEEQRISEAERATLLAMPLPPPIMLAHAEKLLDRINRTFDYWSLGILTASDVPPGENADFIDQSLLANKAIKAEAAIAAEENEGFSYWGESTAFAFNVLKQELTNKHEGVCAKVRLQVSQQAVVTRSAFTASLVLENNGDQIPLDNVEVSISISDTGGIPTSDRFSVLGPDLLGIAAFDGSASLLPADNATGTWTIVPNDLAAPSEPTRYVVRGEIRYVYDEETVTIPLYPVAINVYPNPQLKLKYFIERLVYGDDPFTDYVTEPSVPFSLGVVVSNAGAGRTQNFQITSAQPEIVDNERDLLIDFELIGAQLGVASFSPSLTVNFGAVESGETKVARWLMTSTLQGEFVDYDATFEQTGPLGELGLSLIDSVDIYDLDHVVRADTPSDDAIPDFLVNRVPDIEDLPDQVHLSNGEVAPVTAVTSAVGDGPIRSHDLIALQTVNLPAGWVYIRAIDPGPMDYTLSEVHRGDGRSLRVPDNAWTTRRITRLKGEPEIPVERVHVFDWVETAGEYEYLLVYRPALSVPGPTAIGAITATTLRINEVQGGNLPQIEHAILEESTNQYVGPSGRLQHDPFWQPRSAWVGFQIRALMPSTSYYFVSKARGDGSETGFGVVRQVTTGRQGDLDGDGLVLQADVVIVQEALGTQFGQAAFDARADLNGDDRVTFSDLVIVLLELPLKGDFDGDRYVSESDYASFIECLRGPSALIETATCQVGDFDDDEDVDLRDVARFQRSLTGAK